MRIDSKHQGIDLRLEPLHGGVETGDIAESPFELGRAHFGTVVAAWILAHALFSVLNAATMFVGGALQIPLTIAAAAASPSSSSSSSFRYGNAAAFLALISLIVIRPASPPDHQTAGKYPAS